MDDDAPLVHSIARSVLGIAHHGDVRPIEIGAQRIARRTEHHDMCPLNPAADIAMPHTVFNDDLPIPAFPHLFIQRAEMQIFCIDFHRSTPPCCAFAALAKYVVHAR